MDRIIVKPAPNALAVLKTCRRTKNEIGNTWIAQVLSFEHPETMLDQTDGLASFHSLRGAASADYGPSSHALLRRR